MRTAFQQFCGILDSKFVSVNRERDRQLFIKTIRHSNIGNIQISGNVVNGEFLLQIRLPLF